MNKKVVHLALALALVNLFIGVINALDLGVLEENLVPFPMSGSTTLQDGTVLVVRYDWGYRNQIFKSVDNGKTLAYLSTLPVNTTNITTHSAKMYCTSRDTVLVADGGWWRIGKIFRSQDKGLTWSVRKTLEVNETIWSFFEDSHGRIYAGVYSYDNPITLTHAKLLRSIDDGLTWNVIAYFSGYRHIHDVFVNKYNGYIYVAVGDWPLALMRSKDDGVSWTNLDSIHLYTAINGKGDSNTIYVGQDGYSAIYRFNDTGESSIILEKVYDYGSRLGGNIFWMVKVKGKLVFGTVSPQTNWKAVLGVSDAEWNTFYKVLERTTLKSWQGFNIPTRSYWNISKIYVQDTAQSSPYGTAYEPSPTSPLPPSPFIFESGFETGDFSEWTGTYTSTGEAAAVVQTLRYHGKYSAKFTSNGGGGTENAHVYKSLSPTRSELYARAYVYVDTSGIADNGDRHWFISFRSPSSGLAWAGWYKIAGKIYWALTIRDGASWVNSLAGNPSAGQWYSVELHWVKDGVNGYGEMWVDGVLLCSLHNKDTDNFGDASVARFGLEAVNVAYTRAYIDSVAIDDEYIGSTLSYTFGLES